VEGAFFFHIFFTPGKDNMVAPHGAKHYAIVRDIDMKALHIRAGYFSNSLKKIPRLFT